MKTKVFKSGYWTIFDKDSGGFYVVKLYKSNGELHDKVRCDEYRSALYYFKSFNLIAKHA